MRLLGARARRGDCGLAALEWLLVVAAVAGLAALAVVLVQNTVGDTAEQIDSSDARQTAADLAVTEVRQRWQAEEPATQAQADSINRRYARRCRQLGIIYADISQKVQPPKPGRFDPSHAPGWAADPQCTLA